MVRSKLSLSTSAVVPTTTTATSLAAASATAAAISSSSVPCGGTRLSCTTVPNPAVGEELTSYSATTSADWPAASSTGATCCGGRIRASPMSAFSGSFKVVSKISAPSTNSR